MTPGLQAWQDALTRGNAHFRWMIEHLEDVVALLNPDATIAYLSPSFERRLGHAPADLLGTDAFALIHPDDHDATRRALQAAIASPGAAQTAHYRYRHRDGTWRHFEATGSVLPAGPTGSLVMVVSRDVTEQLRGEEAERLLASIVQSSEDVIVTTDMNGTILSWNPAAERLMGFRAEEAIGASALPHIPPELLEETLGRVGAILRGETLHELETERLHKDGTRIPLSMTVFPLRNESGGILGVACIARDLRERRVAAEAIRAKAAMRHLFRRTLRESAREHPEAMREAGRRLAAEVAAGSMDDFASTFTDMGLGNLRVVESQDGRHVIEGHDLVEARPCATQPTCNLALGFLEAAAGTLGSGAGLGAELECQSLGDDRCLFVVRSRPGARTG